MLGSRLYPIYPKLKSTVSIRPELNRIIFPRKQLSKKRLAIFWTNTSGIKDGNFWSPNHFSPCFPKHFLLESKQKSMCDPKKDEKPLSAQRNGLKSRISINKEDFVVPARARSLTPCRQNSLTRSVASNAHKNTPKKSSRNTNSVRFNIESKCDLAIHLVAKQSKRIQIKSLKRGKNPLKSIFRFFLGHHHRDSRGPDVSFYEIEQS